MPKSSEHQPTAQRWKRRCVAGKKGNLRSEVANFKRCAPRANELRGYPHSPRNPPEPNLRPKPHSLSRQRPARPFQPWRKNDKTSTKATNLPGQAFKMSSRRLSGEKVSHLPQKYKSCPRPGPKSKVRQPKCSAWDPGAGLG